jgi:hypothetical protein
MQQDLIPRESMYFDPYILASLRLLIPLIGYVEIRRCVRERLAQLSGGPQSQRHS